MALKLVTEGCSFTADEATSRENVSTTANGVDCPFPRCGFVVPERVTTKTLCLTTDQATASGTRSLRPYSYGVDLPQAGATSPSCAGGPLSSVTAPATQTNLAGHASGCAGLVKPPVSADTDAQDDDLNVLASRVPAYGGQAVLHRCCTDRRRDSSGQTVPGHV